MILNEVSAVPSEAMPVAAFSEHLHLGSGFSNDGAQASVLEAYLRAALAAIEARSGNALFRRRFSWVIYKWARPSCQPFPVTPVQSVEQIRLISVAGDEVQVDAARYHLQQDNRQPRLVATGATLPQLPFDGSAEVIFEAGFGPVWEDIPADLRQSVLMLAAHHYENRSGGDGKFPPGVLSLLEPYRKFRLSGGSL